MGSVQVVAVIKQLEDWGRTEPVGAAQAVTLKGWGGVWGGVSLPLCQTHAWRRVPREEVG